MRIDARPSLSTLRWITDPGAEISPSVRSVLMGELLSSPSAILMGGLNGLIVKSCAIYLLYRPLFVVLFGLEIFCCVARLWVMAVSIKQICKPIHLDIMIIMTIFWAIIGPICARNYPAPRLAFLLVCLCDFPFVAGAATSGQAWLYALVPMTPPFLYGTMTIVKNFQKVAVSALTGELVGHEMARRDPLTGLPNRLAFIEALQFLSNVKDEKFSILCMDLDGFKHVNDTLGHHGGDRLLQAVACRLAANIKGTDKVFRIGGDEFVVMAHNLLPSGATKLADRIIERLTCDGYQIDRKIVKIGASIGFVCSPEDGVDADELYQMADAALYASKAAGKGVFSRAGPRLVKN